MDKSNEIIFKIVEHRSDEYKSAIILREEEILLKSLGLHFTDDELEAEKSHIHIVGSINNTIVASAVLVPEEKRCKMQRVVVKQDRQNAGIGSKMMQYCENIAKNKGFEFIYCYARASAVEFYIKNGYSREGDYFEEFTIPHLKMRKHCEQ